jgi:oligoribonuclease
MTTNAFAALQGLNDAQLRSVASGASKKKTSASAKQAAAAAAAESGGASTSAAPAPPPSKQPPAPPPEAVDDDDGFTPVVTKGGKRKEGGGGGSSSGSGKPPAASATVTATATASKTKKISKDSRSASKTWADEIEEHEEANGDNGAAAATTTANAAATANSDLLLRDPLVWVDLEMTGLDVRKDTIIEIAVMVSDGQLKRVIEGPEIAIRHPDAVLDDMNEWSQEQHAKSGLVARCRASSVDLAEAEEHVLEFVKKHCAYQTGILAGNSVHVDRAFLMHRMPKLLEHLHYRIVDVSSVAELARRWHPKVWREAPKKKKAHTALADVRESLAELRYYRERLFIKRS